MLLLYVACLLAGAIVVFVRKSTWRFNYSKTVPSQIPNFLNIFGDFKDLWTVRKDVHQNVMDIITKRAKMFQKQGLFCCWFSYVPLIFLVRADTVKVVLKSNKILNKGWMYEWFKPLIGESLLTSSGEKWKYQKRLLTPCFHADVVRSFVATFNEESQNLVNALRGEAKKEFTYINEKTRVCTLDIASETICGVTTETLKARNMEYLSAMQNISSIFMSRVYSPWLWPDFIFWKTLGREMKKGREIMEHITKSIIEEKKKRYLRGEKITLKGKRKAMLDLMLEKHFETQELSEDDIRKEVNLFLRAGQETLATTINWALFLLGHNPEAQARLHEELDRVFADDPDRAVKEEDFQDLPYLECVLKETLRLYPGIPLFVREAPEDMNIRGYPIPKGTACIVFVYSLHRDEDVFPDPEKFDPDRFSLENRVNIPEFAYVPFSAGPRNCIGNKFSDIELKIILTWIMRNFSVESLDPREKIKPLLNITIHSTAPIRIRIRPRHIPKPA